MFNADVTQKLADFDGSSGGLFGHVEAFGDGGADLGGLVLRCDVLSEHRCSFVNGLAGVCCTFHQTPAQPGGPWQENGNSVRITDSYAKELLI